MQTSHENSTITTNVGTLLTVDTRKVSQPVYYIEELILNDDIIGVVYTIDDEWNDAIIDTADLKTFAANQELNSYCFDYYVSGTHIQDCGSLDPDTYFDENMSEVVRLYLVYKKIGYTISHKLTDLINILNN